MPKVSLEMTDEQIAHLDALQERCGLPNQASTLKNAISVFEWVVNEREAGNKIAAVNEKRQEYRVLEMTLREQVAATASNSFVERLNGEKQTQPAMVEFDGTPKGEPYKLPPR